jgi:hypothetical protein
LVKRVINDNSQIKSVRVRRIPASITEKKLRAHRAGRDYTIEEQALKSLEIYGKPDRPKKQGGKNKSARKK